MDPSYCKVEANMEISKDHDGEDYQASAILLLVCVVQVSV